MQQAQDEHIRLFGKLMRQHEYMVHKICHKYGIYRGQNHILRALENNPGLTQNELALMINVAKASVTTSLNRMEKNGFVRREKSKEDGRCNQIYITQKGLEASHGCTAEMARLKEALFSKIDDQELSDVNRILTKLIGGLDSLEESQ